MPPPCLWFYKLHDLVKVYYNNLEIHTLGKIIYFDDKICLQSLSEGHLVELNFLPHLLPEDGTYTHLFGILYCTIDVDAEADEAVKHTIRVEKWSNIEYFEKAEELNYLLSAANAMFIRKSY